MTDRLPRVLDVTLAGTGLIVMALPVALSLALIKLTDPRMPVFYRQTRIGRGGQPFSFVKLRTMSSREASGLEVTASTDSRVTRVGRVLRRLKLDELPQLWNVLRGDMSIVGPRPEVPKYVAHYTDSERQILEVTPGLAGMSQFLFANEGELLNGHDDVEAFYLRSIMPAKLRADLEYERNRTILSDMWLMLKLALQVVGIGRRRELRIMGPQSRLPSAEKDEDSGA